MFSQFLIALSRSLTQIHETTPYITTHLHQSHFTNTIYLKEKKKKNQIPSSKTTKCIWQASLLLAKKRLKKGFHFWDGILWGPWRKKENNSIKMTNQIQVKRSYFNKDLRNITTSFLISSQNSFRKPKLTSSDLKFLNLSQSYFFSSNFC